MYILDLYNYLHTCMHVLTSFFFRTFHTTGLAFARHDSMMINMSKSSVQLAFIPWRALLIKHQQHMNQKDTASFHGSCHHGAASMRLPLLDAQATPIDSDRNALIFDFSDWTSVTAWIIALKREVAACWHVVFGYVDVIVALVNWGSSKLGAFCDPMHKIL